jgi:tetratricopeptide (TPR) repeat protein
VQTPDDTASELDLGLSLHQQGKLADAESVYLTILHRQPAHAGALHLLGVIALQTGRLEQAVALIGKSLSLDPRHAGAYCNHGTALAHLGHLREALSSFDRAIALRPDYAEAHNNRGGVLRDLGQAQEAVASYDRAIELREDYGEARYNRALQLADLGRTHEALADYDAAIALRPDYVEAHNNRGAALAHLGRAHEALLSYDRAIALKPGYAEAYNNRGTALADLGRIEEALSNFDRAIALNPDRAEVFNNRGGALTQLGKSQEALASYDRAIELKPDHAEAFNNRGAAFAVLGRTEEALSNYASAIALRPDYADAHCNQSLCHLSMGDYETGWRMYEWRWKAGLALRRADLTGPSWIGDSLIDGKTIVVHGEQGSGDSIQFCRYVPMLAARATVILDVPAPLRRLLSGVEGVTRVVATGDPLPPFDTWIPMMSLPLAFRTTLETIPAAIPYLHADPERSAEWKRRLAALPGRKIGLVWAGAPRHADPHSKAVDRRRSITLRHYAPFAAIPGVSLISLQKGEAAAQARTPPGGMVLHDWTDELLDFADTAALIEALDLVISVDTSVAHLAGALGKPVWVLNRYDLCWRWLRDRSDSPWYPSARLFQQRTPGDWSGVIDEVAAALLARW